MGRTRTKRIGAALLLATLSTGCADMSKQEIGTLAGAVIGGVVGHKLGGREGAAVGLLVGGLLGNRFGAYLDDEDRKQLAALETAALDTGQSGSFTARKSGAKVSVAASAATMEARKPFVLAESLAETTLVLVESASFDAYVDTPLFGGIDEKAVPRMVIPKGSRFQVAANVQNEAWAVVGDSNVGVGYVPMRYLKDSIASDPTRYGAPVPVVDAPKRPRGKAVLRNGTQNVAAPAKPASAVTTAALTSKEEYDRELTRLRSAYPAPVSSSTQGTKTVAVAVGATQSGAPAPRVIHASLECKVVVRKVEIERGEPLTESIKYCKEPPKGWQTQLA